LILASGLLIIDTLFIFAIFILIIIINYITLLYERYFEIYNFILIIFNPRYLVRK